MRGSAIRKRKVNYKKIERLKSKYENPDCSILIVDADTDTIFIKNPGRYPALQDMYFQQLVLMVGCTIVLSPVHLILDLQLWEI